MRRKPSKAVLNEIAQVYGLVDRTSVAMKAKLLQKCNEGKRGWKTDVDGLLDGLNRAIYRRNYLDICNLAAMLYDYQQRNSQRPSIKKGQP